MKVRRGIAFLIALLLCVNLLAVPIAYALDGGEPEQTEGGASPTTENTEREEASEPDGIETITVEIGEPSPTPKETDRPEATPAGEASPAASSASETPKSTDEPDPTAIPSDEANEPTPAPTEKPSENPTAEPTAAPSEKPASDPKADVENEADWTRMFPQDKLTGIWADDLLALAKSQRGYRESAKNYIEENGEKKGYTRYGAWNKTPYADWNALFVAFCLRYAGVPEEKLPTAATVEAYLAALEGKPLFVSAKNLKDCVPVPGDLVFLRTEPDGECDRMGIVSEVNRDESGAILSLTAIEGDVDGSVQTQSYRFGVKWIAGLAALPAQPTQEPVATSEPTAAPTQEPVATPEPTAAPSTTPEPTAVPMSTKPFAWKKTVGDVVVSVKAEAGAFPIGATLWAERVEAPHVDAAVDEAREGDRNVAVSYTFDIKILDAFGNELQPAEGKKVKVSFSLAEVANENLDTQVYHIEEQGSELTASALEVETAGETATVETDGFSYYTVEFTYEGKMTKIHGGDTVPLKDILNAVGLNGKIEAVVCSDPTLFSASEEGEDWLLYSHRPFDEAWMDVTLDGIVYRIQVTDSQNDIPRDPTFAKKADIATFKILPLSSTHATNFEQFDGFKSASDGVGQYYYYDGTIPYGSAKTLDGSILVVYKNKAVDSKGRNNYDVRIKYSDITIYPRTAGYDTTNPRIANRLIDGKAAFNPYGTWNGRYGITAKVEMYITWRNPVTDTGDPTPLTKGTFICTLSDINITRSDSLGDGAVVDGTSHYNFAESVELTSAGPVYFHDTTPCTGVGNPTDSSSNVPEWGLVGSRYVARNQQGLLSEIASCASAGGASASIWSSGIQSQTKLYLLPDEITYTITSSSGYYGKIEVWKTGSIGADGKNFYGGRYVPGAVDEKRTYDVPCGKAVTYKMTPEYGYILDQLKVNGTEVQPTSVVYKADGTVDYYTYTFPGTIASDDDQTIHVTWQPAITLNFEKEWDDLSNRYGLRPSAIDITLSPWPTQTTLTDAEGNASLFHQIHKCDPTKTSATHALTASDPEGEWKHTYLNLPKYEKGTYDEKTNTGTLIAYTITETVPDHYTQVLPHVITKVEAVAGQTEHVVQKDADTDNHWDFTSEPLKDLVPRVVSYKIVNRLDRGALVIEKDTIPDDAADTFEYTVTIELPGDGKVTDGSWTAMTDGSGKWTKTVTVAGDKLSEPIVLPKGTTYTVTETEKDGWRLIAAEGAAGEILAGDFYAYNIDGALYILQGGGYVDVTGAPITKLPENEKPPLASDPSFPSEVYYFDKIGARISANDSGNFLDGDGNPVKPEETPGWNVSYERQSVADGQYVVYKSTNAKASHTVIGYAVDRARFTNLKLVDLTVVKQVEGNQASRDKYFKVTVTLTIDPSKYSGNKDFKNNTVGISNEIKAELIGWIAGLNTQNAIKTPSQNAATSYTASEMARRNSRDDIPSSRYSEMSPEQRESITWTKDGDTYEWDGVEWLKNGEPVPGVPADATIGIPGQQIVFDSHGEAEVVFYLQHGDSVIFEDLPYGIEYTVTETPEDYRPRVEPIDGDDKDGEGNDDGEDIPNGFDFSEVRDSFLREDTTVTFVNTRKGAIPVGIFTGVGPAVASVGTAFGLLAVRCLPRKRKRHARRR